MNYENYPENDLRAFQYLNSYISLAKKKKDYEHLTQGYNDALFYSPSENIKLKYADSTIYAAKLSGNSDLISDAYLGKGTVYYFNFRKYRPALDEYLKAFQYSKNTKNDFLENSILYHIGVVKSYLGDYDEALVHFKKTSSHFEMKTKENIHPNLIYNNKKGYYNSLHQMIVCYRQLNNYKSVNSLIGIGLSQTVDNKDYQQEYGYFLKEKGIEEYRNKQYNEALKSLQKSIKSISGINDFAWLSVDYFYAGKSYVGINDFENAMPYFRKVDSIFQKHSFILPELRENYEELINYYKKKNDNKQELFYTKQLLKADEVISKDFLYLASVVHKEYDTKTLREEKERLEKATSQGKWLISGLVFLAISLAIILVIKYRNEKRIKKNYKILEEKILEKNEESVVSNIDLQLKNEDKSGINDDTINDIVLKLENFENSYGFTESNLTVHKLATRFNTNHNYLSKVVNKYKGTTFTKYINELRINYITGKLYNDDSYLKYKTDTLAKKCGIASRTNFSNLFYEINKIRPNDFISQRKKELGNEKKYRKG